MGLIKRFKWIGWITSLLLFIVVISTIYQLVDIKSGAVIAPNEEVKTPVTRTVFDHGVSKYPGLNLRTKTEETDKYTMSLSVPTADSETINAPIQKWIEQQKEKFLVDIKKNDSQLGNGHVAHLNIQLETKKIANDIYTLLFTSHQYTGGANGQNTIKPFIINIKRKKILQLSDIIDLNEESIEKIQALIQKELKTDEELNTYIMEELLEEALRKPDELKWLINKKAFVVYFNEYEIAAGAAGVIEVNIPFEKLRPYLSNDFLKEWPDPAKKEAKKEEEVKKKKKELNPDGKYIALTFDDGPSPDVTLRILEILNEYDAKATFFMLGNQVEYYPEVAKQVAKAGHEVANHSNSHPDMTKLSHKAIQSEINKTTEKIEKATGKKSTLLRPPYGAFNNNVINYGNNSDHSIILWSVDSLDWINRINA